MKSKQEEWEPEVGDIVDIVKSVYGKDLRRNQRVFDAKIDSVQEYKGKKMYRVRFKVPWGESSGWYTREQMERSN